MTTLAKLILFFLCNLAGFFAAPFVYLITMQLKIIDVQAEGFDMLSFYTLAEGDVMVPIVISQPLITWIVCALFSLAVFFVKKKSRMMFFLAPIALPTLHALILTFKFM